MGLAAIGDILAVNGSAPTLRDFSKLVPAGDEVPIAKSPLLKGTPVAGHRDNVSADAAGRIGIFPLHLPELLHDAADSR
jgi:hypothetical protein